MKKIIYLFFILATPVYSQSFNEAKVLKNVETLSNDSLEGRKIGTEGSLKAQKQIKNLYEEYDLLKLNKSYDHRFNFNGQNGNNLIGLIKGSEYPEKYIVLSAHYDHLGIVKNKIFNGADDNASGVGALIALMDFYKTHPPRHSIIIAAFDGEEANLSGVKAFFKNLPISLNSIMLNINMDMISRSKSNELFICGTHHYPFLKKYINSEESESFKVRLGHDDKSKGTIEEDWTFSSDHALFRKNGIPFLYFGVEDHADYHQPSDDFEKIDQGFYLRSINYILSVVRTIDLEF